MIKASHLYCLILLLAAAPVLKAQTTSADAVNAAEDEAIKREADKITLHNKLERAESARQQGDLPVAARLFEDCYALVQRVGVTAVPMENQQVISGLTSVLLELAHRSQEAKDYKKAEERFNRILVIDPSNPAAIAGQRENKKLLALQAGHIPSQEQIERIPSWHSNEVRNATMVQDGKLLYEAGKLDEAEAKLKQAYEEDPNNVAAYQYLRLVKEKRMADSTRRSELASGEALLQVEKAWDVEQRGGKLEPRPNSFNRTNLVYTSKGRQTILSKLDRIRVDSVSYDSLPLGEVINTLSQLSKARDPEKTGINFFISREATAPVAAGAGAIDPTTGLPVAPLPTDSGADVSSVIVKINPGLTDIRLADVLDAITKTSDKPIKYSVLDYAVIFSLRGAEPIPLEIRTFHIDPNTFRQGLESVGSITFGDIQTSSGGSGGSSGGGSSGGGSSGGQGGSSIGTTLPRVNVSGPSTGGGGGGAAGGGGQGGAGAGLAFVTSRSNSLDQLQVSVRNFFATVGVDFNTNNLANAGKAFAWNDRKGVLAVRATAQDLDMIAAVLDTLNQSPPQINIKAKFAEITQNDSRALGFQWTLGNYNLGGGNLVSGGTQPSFNTPTSFGNPAGVFPGNQSINNFTGVGTDTTIAPSSSDGSLSSGLRNPLNAPTIGSLTGILSQPQFKVAIQALEQRDGVDLLTAPEVTTESGRQAQMQAVDIQTIVTGNQANTGNSSGFAGVQSGVNSPIVNQAVTIQPQTSPLSFGPVLDVIPYVSADEFSIQMTIIPTITEFIGYDDPGQFVIQAQQAAGSAPITAQLPLPHFRVRQVTTSVTVWDAQTLVMGGLITDSVTKTKDKVPFLGDLPLVGRLFQSEASSKSKKNLMIFVTPTIVNPDGTRYHSDEEMPFLQNLPQTKTVTQ